MHAPIQAPPATRTLTFLFTDIESSTRLWELYPRAMKDALERHDAILRESVADAHGTVVKTTGDGLVAVFDSAVDGVRCCIEGQRRLAAEPWGETGALRVRMALHSGEAAVREGDYFGPTLNRAARIMAAGHGGQVLLSGAAAALVMDQLPEGTTVLDLGEHRLKDLGRPEHVFQLVTAGLPDGFPPLTTARRAVISGLPDQPTAFLGRDTELQEVEGRLIDGSVRMLTLTGPGGIGKTRLALRAAADRVDDFEDGTVFVDLSAVRDAGSVTTAIARALGLKDSQDSSILDQLEGRLRDQHTLLVLDNFEQVTAAAPTMSQLLAACPRLKLLITSREALHVRGESVFSVPPLSLPDTRRRRSTVEQLGRFEAIQLFVERARLVRPDFRLTDDNAAAVAEICIRLDGLPLAIELATARINLFSPEALRDRLSSSLDLLRSGMRDLPARQQTLKATIEWSYELLRPAEQRLFEVLSVFAGASIEAIEAVAVALEGFDVASFEMVDAVTSLLDKSLVRGAEVAAGEPRFSMLETIKEFATERLADRPELDVAARRAHAAYYADMARRQWERLDDARREVGAAAMAPDVENMRIAWRLWVKEDDLERLEDLVDCLWLVYDARGWYRATIGLSTDMLDALSARPPTPERASREVTLRMSMARALLSNEGYTEEVEQAYARALELVEREGGVPQQFPVLRALGSFYLYRAEFDKGVEIGQAIVSLAESQDDPRLLVDANLVLGGSQAFLGDLHGGLAHLDAAIAASEVGGHGSRRFRLGNDPVVACFTTSGFLLWMLGFPDRAVERANRAIARATQLDHPFTLAYALYHVGFLRLWRREPELVRACAVRALDVADEHDLTIWQAVGTCLLGVADVALGHAEEGLGSIRDGIALYRGLNTPPVFWSSLMFLRGVACAIAGRVSEGLAFVDEAIEVTTTRPSRTLEPELYLLKGDLLQAQGGAAADEIASWYQKAFEISSELDGRTSQLRAATRLARVVTEGDGDVGWADRLAAICATFTEGFATADLVEARAALEGLGRPVPSTR